MLFYEFLNIIQDSTALLRYLRDNHVLKMTLLCIRCSRQMSEQFSEDYVDKVCFRCTRCKTKKSIRTNSFLYNSKLKLKDIASIIYFLLLEVPHKRISEALGINKNTITDFANILREEYSAQMVSITEKLGANDAIVQVNVMRLANN